MSGYAVDFDNAFICACGCKELKLHPKLKVNTHSWYYEIMTLCPKCNLSKKISFNMEYLMDLDDELRNKDDLNNKIMGG